MPPIVARLCDIPPIIEENLLLRFLLTTDTIFIHHHRLGLRHDFNL
ncbi:hypothetical protein DSUL_20349 [Desulfovibrionales bacterium]